MHRRRHAQSAAGGSARQSWWGAVLMRETKVRIRTIVLGREQVVVGGNAGWPSAYAAECPFFEETT